MTDNVSRWATSVTIVRHGAAQPETRIMIYIPPPRRRASLWLALAEFTTLIALWASIIALAVLARAIMGV